MKSSGSFTGSKKTGSKKTSHQKSAASMWSSASRVSRILLLSMVAALCCSSLAAQPPAQADQPELEEAFVVPAEGLSQRQALDRVRARFPGNIISVNEVNQEGRIRFRFRIDNEGNIYTLYVDRATGAITRE